LSVPASEPVSLGEAAYRHLREAIVSCRLPPGQRLTERALAESTGFGISPIRDALTRLSHEGLVKTLPRKGYQVIPLTLKSVDDLFTLWRIVGPEIARLAVRDATAEQRQQIIAAFTATTESRDRRGGELDDDQRLRWLEQFDASFRTLAAATDNDYLISIHNQLQAGLNRVWALILTKADHSLPELPVDGEWIGFMDRRDGDAAAARAQEYIADSHARVLRILSRWPSVVASEITPLHD
jgi:DNA-binding GntR family transcriptional regulator